MCRYNGDNKSGIFQPIEVTKRDTDILVHVMKIALIWNSNKFKSIRHISISMGTVFTIYLARSGGGRARERERAARTLQKHSVWVHSTRAASNFVTHSTKLFTYANYLTQKIGIVNFTCLSQLWRAPHLSRLVSRPPLHPAKRDAFCVSYAACVCARENACSMFMHVMNFHLRSNLNEAIK